MAIDPGRRAVLQALLVTLVLPGTRVLAAPTATGLVAAWDEGPARHLVGLLRAQDDGAVRVVDRIAVPTRAHGLLPLPDGSIVAVARRPGSWLLRWRPGRDARWVWAPEDRRFCGHALLDAQGRLLTTEMDLEHEQGLVTLRDAGDHVLAGWPTGGIDPHELLAEPGGSLLVANGGVPAPIETGRTKGPRDGMDPSLTRLAADDGRRLGQWRLADRRLSVRHLARHADGVVGVALQAEHDGADQRAAAPLLALFDGRSLRAAPDSAGLGGYAGSIAATADGFAVSAPRAGQVARWSSDGQRLATAPLAEACALASNGKRLWMAGRGAVARAGAGGQAATQPVDLAFDNHWALPG